MLDLLKGLVGLRRRSISADAVTDAGRRAVLRELIGKCPICLNGFSNHATWRIATVLRTNPETPSSQVARGAIARGDWTTAIEFQEWDPAADAREFRALRCSSGAISVLTIAYLVGVWSDDRLEGAETLDPARATRLKELVRDEWMPLCE